jgi:hypothetical protein
VLRISPTTVIAILKKAHQENEWVKFDIFTEAAAYR